MNSYKAGYNCERTRAEKTGNRLPDHPDITDKPSWAPMKTVQAQLKSTQFGARQLRT